MTRQDIISWAELQIAVMRQGDDFNGADMHPLPKDRLIEAFEKLIKLSIKPDIKIEKEEKLKKIVKKRKPRRKKITAGPLVPPEIKV